MVSPTPFVRDIHSLFALSRRRDNNPIDINNRLIEERAILLLPNIDSGFVDRLHQQVDVGLLETTTEVASSGWIRNGIGTHRIEESRVVSKPFKMLKSFAIAKDIDCHSQHMI